MVGRISTISLSIENHQDVSKEESADFEKAMEICGNGKYQYTFLLVCGVMFICVGLQYGMNAYILPSAECDLQMRSEEKGLLNVAFLTGCVASALFWGVFSGVYGRRNIILLTLFIDSIVTVLTSFLQNYNLFLVFRIMSGFLMGAPGSLVYTYLGEFHEEKHRAKSICFLGFFFPIAWLLLPALAWIFIPLTVSFDFYFIQYTSWRMFLGFIALPTFIIAMIILRYPESPKFLLLQGKNDEALKVFQEIYAVNTGNDASKFPIKKLLSDTVLEMKKIATPLSTIEALKELLKSIWWQLRTIMSPPILNYAVLLWIIYISNMFGYYGFALWIPELFTRFENYHQLYPNRSATVCELTRNLHDLTNQTVTEEPFVLLANGVGAKCKAHIDEKVFINSLTINAVCLTGSIISGCLSNRVDRRTIPVITMLLAGVSGIGLYFVNSSLQITAVMSMFSLMVSTGNFAIAAVAVDIFPTHVTAAGVSMMICLGRSGAVASNLLLGMLLDLSCEIPIFLLAGVVMFGGLISFLIPSKEKK